MPLVVAAVARLVVPVALTVAVAMLVKGYTAAGDGFVAGALTAVALGLQLVAGGPREASRQPLIRRAGAIGIAGLAVCLAVAFVPTAFGRPLLTHVPAPGEDVAMVGSLELTTAVAFDAGIFLLVVGAVGAMLGRLAVREDEEDPA